MDTPHMVEQVIKFSDGTETVIKYRGVIKDGVLTPDKMSEETRESEVTPEVTPAEEVTGEPVETPEETKAAPVEEVVAE